ncbi:hypothetical protein HID58_001270 [Brassica napus]|uniref:Cation-transporting ATPase n=1 Tax=Brassica napus TaxID=3708 RepID=A0ABQ8ELN6_BRANA|nr:hypothetical protein HID58_001270 [Brassica napus]
MTCPEDEKAVLLLPTRLQADDKDVEKGAYVKLSEGQESSSSSGQEEKEEEEVKEAATSPFWFWVKLALLFSFLASLAFVTYKWLGPLIMDKVCSLLQPNACLLVRAYPNYKMGDKDFHTSSVRSSCLCIRGCVPHYTSSLYSLHVDRWDDLWLRLRLSSHYFSCICWCLASLLHWTSLPPQNSSKT